MKKYTAAVKLNLKKIMLTEFEPMTSAISMQFSTYQLSEANSLL